MTSVQIDSKNWSAIRNVVRHSQNAAMHCSIATICPSGFPTITPIGTLFLNDEIGHGFFFDTYSESINENLKRSSKACIQAVNSSRIFWIKSMLYGSFTSCQGVRLYATIGPLRPANQIEKQQVQQRIQALNWTKGAKLIWADFNQVRDIHIQTFKWVKYPSMRSKTYI